MRVVPSCGSSHHAASPPSAAAELTPGAHHRCARGFREADLSIQIKMYRQIGPRRSPSCGFAAINRYRKCIDKLVGGGPPECALELPPFTSAPLRVLRSLGGDD